MSPLDTTSKTLAGMQEIERAITRRVRERSLSITAAVFSWNHGQGTAELPDPVQMDVRQRALAESMPARPLGRY
jgi:hypothetical protein